MKKIKRILATLLLCALALSLAGCAELDEMKAHHAVWGEERGTVLYNGAVYRALTPSDLLQIWDAKDVIYVTDKDVPVLLSRWYGSTMSVDKSGILLECHGYSAWGGSELYTSFYCREDKYPEIDRQLRQGPDLSRVIYSYWDEEGNEKLYSLTADQIAAVEALLAGVPTESGIERYTLDEDFSFNLERASEDALFRTHLCEVSVDNREISLIKDVENDGLVEVYIVSAEQQPVFQKIIEAFAKMEWTGYYGPEIIYDENSFPDDSMDYI